MAWHSFFTFDLGENFSKKTRGHEQRQLLPGSTKYVDVKAHEAKQQLKKEITMLDRANKYTVTTATALATLLEMALIVNDNKDKTVTTVIHSVTIFLTLLTTVTPVILHNMRDSRIAELNEEEEQQKTHALAV